MRAENLQGVTNIYDETAERAYRLARGVDRPEAEAVFLTGTGMPTLPVLEMLEADLGKPVHFERLGDDVARAAKLRRAPADPRLRPAPDAGLSGPRLPTSCAVPAKAGTHRPDDGAAEEWVPAFAGTAVQM